MLQTPTQTPTLDEVGMVLAHEFGPHVASAVMAACLVAREEWVGANTEAMQYTIEFGACSQRALHAICDGAARYL